jgi:large subunit ribosomal protein L25
MPSTVLTANIGRQTGSRASRRLRGEDQIPGVLYGHGMDPLSVSVDRRDLRVAVSGSAGINALLDLTVDGTVYPAIIKELQRHPVRHTVSHIDFLQVDLDQEITVAIRVRLVGEATAVIQNNGLVDPTVDAIDVITTPGNIPDEFVIDVSDMEMDSVIRLQDVPMPEGVQPAGDPETPVVTVLTMRAEVAEIEALDAELAEEQHEAAEAEAEGEGEAAPVAEGEAEAPSGEAEGTGDASE